MIIIDAIIVLNEEIKGTNNGINLLDGLKLAYHGHYSYHRSWTRPDTSITQEVFNKISIPEINYSMNIFQTEYAKSEILARPSLLAQDGKTATYFSGKKLLLGISGADTSTIETFPIGLSMSITPEFRPDGSVTLGVTVGRDFLEAVTTNLTTFTDVASELSEKVKTTVNLHFGETAILSALSERDLTSAHKYVPFFGKLPGVKYLFGNKDNEQVNNSVLILLTPEHYKSYRQVPELQNSPHVRKIMNRLVEPKTNLSAVVDHLSQLRLYQGDSGQGRQLYSKNLMLKAAETEYRTLDHQVY